MPNSPGLSPRALVSPDREALRVLRDRYMREMEARSYDEVRNKFLEELQSKSGPASQRGASSALQRERGAGIWNKAFASASKVSGAGDPQGLSLKEPGGTAHPLGPEVLAAFFRALRGDVECVVLSGCYAEPQARAIFRHVPYVIGVRPQAGAEGALAFLRRFYHALGEGLPIPKAFQQAVAEGQREGRFENALPVLLQQQ